MAGKIRFSEKEIKHLLISVFVMSYLVGIILTGDTARTAGAGAALLGGVFNFPFALIIIVPAFVLHEMGHKFTAQKFGFWAEYRMWAQGLLLAILIVLVTTIGGSPMLFIAPGAVYFTSHGFRGHALEKIGKIGLSGPIINLFLAVFFGLIAVLLGGGAWAALARLGGIVNAFLAMFNLIPFAPFDGEKVMSWDKKIWGAAISLAVILFILMLFI